MKEKISFVSEQANSPFLIGQLVNEIFAYYHFLELVVTYSVWGGLCGQQVGVREHSPKTQGGCCPFYH